MDDLKQGTLVQYINPKKQKIIWMVTSEDGKGVVVHSENLLNLGTISELAHYNTIPFIGNVNIKSTANS